MLKVPNRVITRDEAWDRGLTWYFTGKPCKRGHVSTRSYNNSTCHACCRKARAEKANPLVEYHKSRRAFHEQWLAERRAKRLNAKRALDLLS